MLLVFAVCPLVALVAPDDPTEALARARVLVDVERSLGLLVEPGVQAWAAEHRALMAIITGTYLFLHVPATVGVLVWVWLERRAAFVRARAGLLLTQGVVVSGYLVVPTAPPRMLAELQPAGAPPDVPGGLADLVQSPYAAVPSGHVAFSVVVAAVVARLAGPSAVRRLAWSYPVAVGCLVVLTGNHLWIDVVLGGCAATAGLAGARLTAKPASAPARPAPLRRPARHLPRRLRRAPADSG